MATGYTAGVQDGKITTLKDFTFRCARARGDCVMQRDDSSDALPELPEPSDYHAKALVKDGERIVELDAMSDEDKAAMALKEYEAEKAFREKSRADDAKSRARYSLMLQRVRAWEPPSEEHAGLKEFMIEQLESSIKFDCHENSAHNRPPDPAKYTPEAWFLRAVEGAERSVLYHTKHNAEEIERTNGRREWIQALFDCFDATTK